MITRWEKGRAEVDRLISENRIEKVSASRDLADAMIEQAQAHMASAAAALSLGDDAGAFQLRNNTEYPDVERQTATAVDVQEALPAAEAIIRTARTVLDRMPVY